MVGFSHVNEDGHASRIVPEDMFETGVMRRRVVAGSTLSLALALFAGCEMSPRVDPPAPTAVADVVTELPPPPPSVVDAEIRYDLEPALAALEQAVPRSFGDIAQRNQVGSNKRAHFAFAAKRSPFVISVDGRRIAISGVIEYEGRGYYKPFIGPEVSAACGTGGVDRPRARVRIESTIDLTEQWSLAAKSRVSRVEPYSTESRDRCRVTLFRIDVTDKVINATRGVLEQRLSKLDRALEGINTRARFEQWWRAIERPIRLTDSIYFTINPHKVQLGAIEVDSGFATARIRLEATPKIQTGPRPNDFDYFKPLPPLQKSALVGKGLWVTLEGEFGYDVANALLRKNLVGKEITQGGRKVRIKDLELSGIGAGRVALGVRFEGSVKGQVYFIGTPKYDDAADQLSVPDLSYDLRTQDLLVRGLAWLREDWLRDFLREKARFPVEGQLDRLRTLAEKGMNRRLADGVYLVATVDRAKGVSVLATRRALLVRASANGDARLDINKAPTVKRKAPPVVSADRKDLMKAASSSPKKAVSSEIPKSKSSAAPKASTKKAAADSTKR
jgi:hypothetical protein